MSILNLLCPICTDIFRNVEEIHSTSCGHVFHFQCMSQWRNRSTSCPQCRSPNPTTFKLYLSFDETEDAVKELRNKLDNSAHEIKQLKIKFQGEKKSLSDLRGASEATIAELRHILDNSAHEINEWKIKFQDGNKSLSDLRAASEAKIAELSNKLDNSAHEINKWKIKFQNGTKSLSDLRGASEATIAELRHKLDNSAHEINEWKIKFQDGNKSLSDLRAASEAKIAERNDKSTQKINELQIMITDKNMSLCNSQREIESLKGQIVKVSDIKASSEAIVDSLKNEIADLKADIMNTKESLEIVVSEKNKSSSAVAKLKEEIVILKQDLEKNTAQLEREVLKNSHLTVECIQLKAMNASNDSSSSESTELMKYEEKIKGLEHRLNHLSKEFEKEITKSTQLEIDNVKLQGYIGRMQLNSSTASLELGDPKPSTNCVLKTPSIASSSESLNARPDSNRREQMNWRKEKAFCLGDQEKNSSSASFKGERSRPLDSNRRNINKKASFMSSSDSVNMQQRMHSEDSSESLNSRPDSNRREQMNWRKGKPFCLGDQRRNSSSVSIDFQQRRHFEDSSNSIIIQNYPKDNLTYPLENIVLKLATHMNISLNIQDIDKVNIVGRSVRNHGERVTLFIRFKHRDMKMKFLANKSRLSSSSESSMRAVTIKEYVDDKIRDVFLYAKTKLSGFSDIFCTNNKIFAKRDVSDSIGLRIYSRQQVDEIINSPMPVVLLSPIEI